MTIPTVVIVATGGDAVTLRPVPVLDEDQEAELAAAAISHIADLADEPELEPAPGDEMLTAGAAIITGDGESIVKVVADDEEPRRRRRDRDRDSRNRRRDRLRVAEEGERPRLRLKKKLPPSRSSKASKAFSRLTKLKPLKSTKLSKPLRRLIRMKIQPTVAVAVVVVARRQTLTPKSSLTAKLKPLWLLNWNPL